VHGIELQQMRRRRRTSLDLVDVDDVEAAVAPRIVRRTIHAAQRRPQGKTAHATHAVDADAHCRLP